MKKLLGLLLCCSAVLPAKAALFISNNTSCPVTIYLYAHDAVSPSLNANAITLAGFSAVAYNNVTSLNASPGWLYGYMATLTGPLTPGWDCFKFVIPSSGVSSGVGITCGSPSPQTYTNACGGQPVTVTWTDIGGNTLVNFN